VGFLITKTHSKNPLVFGDTQRVKRSIFCLFCCYYWRRFFFSFFFLFFVYFCFLSQGLTM
jgi:hypothetical protein